MSSIPPPPPTTLAAAERPFRTTCCPALHIEGCAWPPAEQQPESLATSAPRKRRIASAGTPCGC
eukprot:5405196-Prymnesium_polylepis.1